MNNSDYSYQEQYIVKIQNAIQKNLSFELIRQLLDPKYQNITINVINSQYGQLILNFLKNNLIYQYNCLLQQQRPGKDLFDLIFTLNKILSISYCGNEHCYYQIEQLILKIGLLTCKNTFQLFHNMLVEILWKLVNRISPNGQNIELCTQFVLNMLQRDDLTICELRQLLASWAKIQNAGKLPEPDVVSTMISSANMHKYLRKLPEFIELVKTTGYGMDQPAARS